MWSLSYGFLVKPGMTEGFYGFPIGSGMTEREIAAADLKPALAMTLVA